MNSLLWADYQVVPASSCAGVRLSVDCPGEVSPWLVVVIGAGEERRRRDGITRFHLDCEVLFALVVSGVVRVPARGVSSGGYWDGEEGWKNRLGNTMCNRNGLDRLPGCAVREGLARSSTPLAAARRPLRSVLEVPSGACVRGLGT